MPYEKRTREGPEFDFVPIRRINVVAARTRRSRPGRVMP